MIRFYRMTARPGEEAALQAALEGLAQVVRAIEGNVGVELLVDHAAPGRFVFLERWRDHAAYEAGSKLLAKAALAPVMAALGEPPEAAKLDPLLAI
jgi:quinol monooxygenase YgiN